MTVFHLFCWEMLVLPHSAIASYVFEKTLHKILLGEYRVDVLPEVSYRAPVVVEFDFILEKVNQLNVKEQVLDVSAFITLRWNDPQLKWNKTEFGGIESMVMSRKLIWTPDITLYNTGENEPIRNHLELYKTKLKVESTGNVLWISPTNLKASCECDIKWYPVDVHVCTLEFGSWSYHHKKLKLVRSVNMDRAQHLSGGYHGVSSGNWAIRNIVATSTKTIFRCCKDVFETISIEIDLKRMPLYYLVYTLIPLVALVLMMVMIFRMHLDQRASFGVTILLSISVFIMVLEDELPPKSNDMPWLGIVFVLEYLILSLAIPLAQYTGRVAQRSDRPVPEFMINIISLCGRYPAIKGATGMEGDGTKTEVATVEGEEEEEEAIDTNDCFSNQWMAVGRFLDDTLSIIYFLVLIFLPIILAGVLS